MTSIPSNDSSIPLFAQILTASPRVPDEGYGAEADQTVAKVSINRTKDGAIEEDGAIQDFSLEINLVPHNMRCEPPRGYNR
jgi:hypothetical protein